MRAAGPAPAASRPALASDASLRLQSPIDRVLWLVAAAVLAALLILLGVEHYWLRGLKFDDAYIHFRYAENIARGEGFVYNPGERVLGSGAIPWNLMLAALAALRPPGAPPPCSTTAASSGARSVRPSCCRSSSTSGRGCTSAFRSPTRRSRSASSTAPLPCTR